MKKLMMALAILPLMAAAETEKVGNITWSHSISNGKATVECANPCSGSVTIPSLLDGCSVTGIGVGGFLYCRALTSVMIPAGVANISYCSCEGVSYNKVRQS